MKSATENGLLVTLCCALTVVVGCQSPGDSAPVAAGATPPEAAPVAPRHSGVDPVTPVARTAAEPAMQPAPAVQPVKAVSRPHTAVAGATKPVTPINKVGFDSSPEPDLSELAMEEAAARNSPAVGKTALPFTLMDQDGQVISLSDYAGQWVVLYFYPKDDTPGCTCQATEFTKLLSSYRDMNAKILGVSPDAPLMHRIFRDKYDIKITLLSDPDKAAMQSYGAWVTTTVAGASVARVSRSTFIIDPQGRIAYHWPEVIPKGHAARVQEKLAELKRSQGA